MITDGIIIEAFVIFLTDHPLYIQSCTYKIKKANHKQLGSQPIIRSFSNQKGDKNHETELNDRSDIIYQGTFSLLLGIVGINDKQRQKH
ncbi:hypothetical protein D3C78_1655220 [compost metagenome]